MDLSGIEVKPAEGMLAVRFVDDIDGEEAQEATNPAPAAAVPETKEDEALVAVVLGVGASVKGVKKSDTVILRSYARHGLRIGKNTAIVEAYSLAAILIPPG